MIKYFTIEDLLKHYLQKKFHILNFGSLTPDKWLNRKGYHMIISERYVSIYRLIEKTVYIYHIADTQTEYTKLFS